MTDKSQVDLISQVIDSMDEASIKLEDAYNENNIKNLELARRELLEFQKQLAKELKTAKTEEKQKEGWLNE